MFIIWYADFDLDTNHNPNLIKFLILVQLQGLRCIFRTLQPFKEALNRISKLIIIDS